MIDNMRELFDDTWDQRVRFMAEALREMGNRPVKRRMALHAEAMQLFRELSDAGHRHPLVIRLVAEFEAQTYERLEELAELDEGRAAKVVPFRVAGGRR